MCRRAPCSRCCYALCPLSTPPPPLPRLSLAAAGFRVNTCAALLKLTGRLAARWRQLIACQSTRRITPCISGRGAEHWWNDTKLARRAPLHALVSPVLMKGQEKVLLI